MPEYEQVTIHGQMTKEELARASDINFTRIRQNINSKIVDLIYPIGAIYISVTSTSPETLFGGTWSAFGAGRTLVGLDSGDTDFDATEETGGAKTVAGDPHSHSLSAANAGVPYGLNSTKTYVNRNGPAVSVADANVETTSWSGAGATTITTSLGLEGDTDSESPAATSVVQPYIVTYMWKRTA